ncbi:MAG: sigma-70 family RNA polymerase sigma factor [Phycisphaerae bacterium]|jgi:RNA polymerase sigma-70 factor (ECF subfamily)
MRQRDVEAEALMVDRGEVALVNRAQEGETEAFADLVRKYQRRAVSLAYRLLGNAEDASDVSQEAFVRAYRNLSQLEQPERFGAWLMRVVSNLSLNYRRSRAIRSTSPLDDASDGVATGRNPRTGRPVTVGLVEESGALPDELQRAINDAMERLPDKQRLALILFSVEGVPQKEVAEILQCSVELVKWNVFQARQKLKEMLSSFL